MGAPAKLRKLFRLLIVFLLVYVLWSVWIDVRGLDHEIDNEAIVPCLFFLPPAGFLVIGIILVKLAESIIFLRLVKFIRHRFFNPLSRNSPPIGAGMDSEGSSASADFRRRGKTDSAGAGPRSFKK